MMDLAESLRAIPQFSDAHDDAPALRAQVAQLLEATPALKAIGLDQPDWRARLNRLVSLAGLEEENEALKSELDAAKASLKIIAGVPVSAHTKGDILSAAMRADMSYGR